MNLIDVQIFITDRIGRKHCLPLRFDFTNTDRMRLRKSAANPSHLTLADDPEIADILHDIEETAKSMLIQRLGNIEPEPEDFTAGGTADRYWARRRAAEEQVRRQYVDGCTIYVHYPKELRTAGTDGQKKRQAG